MPLSEDDRTYLTQAIGLSRRSLEEDGWTPFGALIVIDGEVIGQGHSQVVELRDPTAHAEVMALRDASQRLQRHILDDAVMYASSEPCPMCLAACYWARVPRLVFAATTHDVATNGFEDLQYYRELAAPASARFLTEEGADEPQRAEAREILQAWTERLPGPVVPKL
ncbi:nucleoside deaminase [Streptomyces sp. NPDC002248]